MNSVITEIPGPRRQPFFGNLLQIPRGKLAQYLLSLSREYGGIFQLDFAGYPVPFVCSAELVAELSDERRFRKIIRPPLSLLRRVAGDGLFTARSDDLPWSKAHRILMPAFAPRAMKDYFGAMLEVGQALVASWEAREGQDLLVADDMTRLTLDTISLAGFGYRFDSFAQAELHPFLSAMVRVLSDTMARLTRLPVVNRLSREPRHIADDIALMNALVDDVIRQRRSQPADTNDLLNLMLHAVDPETGEPLDDTNIRHQVITFLVAGHETTSGLLTFALYLLLRNPHVLAQAYAEVDRVMPGDKVPKYADLSRLNVIERALKETLRLWPTAPGYTVAPYEDTVIGGRYVIKKDRGVSVSIPALHRDPAVWPNPDVFDIDRFLPEAEAARHPHAYKPFGNGERACIGRQFALTEAKLALALILQRFALSDPYDYRLRINETLTLKPDGFYLRARRRQPHERIASLPDPAMPSSKAPRPAAPQMVVAAGAPLTVLYGTSLGTSREIAGRVAAQAARIGFEVTLATLDERITDLPTDGVLVVVTSTYNGKAPDSARQTEQAIAIGALQSLRRPNLRYAVLGCGDSQWPNYQAFPTAVDRLLAGTGATPLLPRSEVDASGDFETAAERWLEAFSVAVGGRAEDAGAAAPVTITMEYGRAEDARSSVHADTARFFTVLSNDELVHDPAGLWDFSREAPRSSTRHIVLAMPDGVGYRTGDHLAVYPCNSAERVREVTTRLGLDLDDVVTLTDSSGRSRHLPLGMPVTVRRLLTDFVELQDPVTRRDIAQLMEHTRCPHTRRQLEKIASDLQAAPAAHEHTDRRPTVPDLLREYPAIELPLAAFLGMCAPLRPRLYSIASSADASPRTLVLTVGTVSGPARSGRGQFNGVASTYLRDLAPGDRLVGELRRPDPPFAPSDDPAATMILIGPGTGFAPFRGFLEERAAQKERGVDVATSIVFYGCRHPDHDWLYRDEMRRWQSEGLIDLHLAFSCLDSHPHRFVQDVLWAERGSVWQALSRGATVYVCGDGRFMAPAVRDCLIRIHREMRGSSMEDASAWLQVLVEHGRYRQDVFGAG